MDVECERLKDGCWKNEEGARKRRKRGGIYECLIVMTPSLLETIHKPSGMNPARQLGQAYCLLPMMNQGTKLGRSSWSSWSGAVSRPEQQASNSTRKRKTQDTRRKPEGGTLPPVADCDSIAQLSLFSVLCSLFSVLCSTSSGQRL